MPRSRTSRWLWLLPALWLVAPVPAQAVQKLIHMNNGKVLRAESVERDGDWLMATLDGGHVLGIQAILVHEVVDDLGEDNDTGANLNVVTSGRYVPRGGGSSRFSSRRGRNANPSNPLTEQPQPPAQEEKPPEPAGAVVGGAVVPGQPGVVTPQPGASRRRNLAGRTRSNRDN
jgi:hypothetical protein